MNDPIRDSIDEALRAGDELDLDEMFAYIRAQWREIRAAGGEPGAMGLIFDKAKLTAHYRGTTMKPTEAYYYLNYVAHDFLTSDFGNADEDDA